MWGVPFIMAKYGIDKAVASGAVMTIYIGFGLGASLIDYAATLLQSHRQPMRYGALCTLTVFLSIIYLDMPFWLVYVALLSAGFFTAMQLISFTTILSLNPPQFGATASAFHNMLSMCSGIISQPLIGHLIDRFWTGGLNHHGCPDYALSDYQGALLVIPIGLGVSFLLSFFMTDSFIPAEPAKPKMTKE